MRLPHSQTFIQSQAAYIMLTSAWMMNVWSLCEVFWWTARVFIYNPHTKLRAILNFDFLINYHPTRLSTIGRCKVWELNKANLTLQKLFKLGQWLFQLLGLNLVVKAVIVKPKPSTIANFYYMVRCLNIYNRRVSIQLIYYL